MCVRRAASPAVSTKHLLARVAEAPKPLPWGYIWTGWDGRAWDPVTLLLLKSTRALLAPGESWGLWGFLYLLGCKYFMGKQPRKIWLAFRLAH